MNGSSLKKWVVFGWSWVVPMLFASSSVARAAEVHDQQPGFADALQAVLETQKAIRENRRESSLYQSKLGGITGNDERASFESIEGYFEMKRKEALRKLEKRARSAIQRMNATPAESLPVLEGDRIAGLSRDVRFYDPEKVASSPSQLFLNQDRAMLSPISSARKLVFYTDGVEAFARKLELLTGSPVPRAALEGTDGTLSLDFSAAPKLKSILVSTLYIRGDLSGKLLIDALRFHAARGTEVKLMSSATATRSFALLSREDGAKDRKVLEDLRASGGNVQMVEYEDPREKNYAFHSLHRAHHAKLMLLQYEDPSQDRIIVGSRNLADPYVFRKAPKIRGDLGIIQYSPKTYLGYDDLEMELIDPELARNAEIQFRQFWSRDRIGIAGAGAFTYLPIAGLGDQAGSFWQSRISLGASPVRHFFSVPFFDDPEKDSLKTLVERLLDSAKRRIRIVTPYFNLPYDLEKAYLRATRRGVEVEVVTNLYFNSTEEVNAAMVSAANRIGIEKAMNVSKVYAWTDSEAMLHAKAISVDDELLYVGSANLNRRSFAHDTENGVLVTGSAAIDEFNRIFDEKYVKSSTQARKEIVDSMRSPTQETLVRGFLDLF